MPTSRHGETPSHHPAYHHGDLRAALLRAAETLLVEGNPAELSLRAAARTAGVSHSAPYRHFADREALLAALAADGFRRLATVLEAAATAAPVGGELRAVGLAYLGFAAAHRALYLLMFGPEIQKAAHPALAEASGAAMEVLRAALGKTTGEAEAASARHAAVGAWALVHGLAHLIADNQIAAELGVDGHAALAEDAMAIYGAGLRAGQGRQVR